MLGVAFIKKGKPIVHHSEKFPGAVLNYTIMIRDFFALDQTVKH